MTMPIYSTSRLQEQFRIERKRHFWWIVAFSLSVTALIMHSAMFSINMYDLYTRQPVVETRTEYVYLDKYIPLPEPTTIRFEPMTISAYDPVEAFIETEPGAGWYVTRSGYISMYGTQTEP